MRQTPTFYFYYRPYKAQTTPPDFQNYSGSGDLLIGASAIARFVLGDEGQRRRIYYWVDRGYIPVTRVGTSLSARRSTLLAWLAGNKPTDRQTLARPAKGGGQ